MKNVIVPKQDLEKAEKARIAMYKFLQDKLTIYEMFDFVSIEGSISELCYKRYQEIDIEILAER